MKVWTIPGHETHRVLRSASQRRDGSLHRAPRCDATPSQIPGLRCRRPIGSGSVASTREGVVEAMFVPEADGVVVATDAHAGSVGSEQPVRRYARGPAHVGRRGRAHAGPDAHRPHHGRHAPPRPARSTRGRYRDRARRQAAAGRGGDDLRSRRRRGGAGDRVAVPARRRSRRRPRIRTCRRSRRRRGDRYAEYQPRSNDLNGFMDAMEIARRGRARRGDELVPRHQTGDRRRGAVADRAPRLGRPTSPPTRGTTSIWLAGRRSTPTSPSTSSREPRGEWTGVATRAWYSTDGIGHARADLFDRDGFVGTCTASLLVDEVAAPY